jgi:UDP-N-acetylglucosamine 2-epimerase (non-hydrolysing)
MKIKITTIVGTRPEIIRLSEIIKHFDKVFSHRFIHSGQNQDPNLSTIFFKDLDLREPDLFLGNTAITLGKFMGNLFEKMEDELTNNRPDAIVILGDTNSALSAILAKRMAIPVYHLEAGNRSFDKNVPEEINRKIVDHSSDFNLVYTEHARNNLLTEGLHPRTIALTGSPLREVITKNLKKIEQSKILDKLNLKSQKYILVSAHRQENIDFTDRFEELLKTLKEVSVTMKLPVLVSTHPRTKKILSQMKTDQLESIVFHDPFNFSDYNKLQKEALIVLSDSGTISEESSMLNFKAITIRNSMERPEALESGSIVMAGIKSHNVLEAIKIVLQNPRSTTVPEAYKVDDCSIRTTNFILSTVNEYKFWNSLY